MSVIAAVVSSLVLEWPLCVLGVFQDKQWTEQGPLQFARQPPGTQYPLVCRASLQLRHWD